MKRLAKALHEETMIEIRDTVTKEIFGQVLEIWQLTGITTPKRGDTWDSMVSSLNFGGTLLTAWEDGVLCGVCWLSHDARRLMVHHMAVHPDRQNRGIGRMLMTRAVAIGRKMGLQMKLEVHQDNPAARHLYESFGFSYIGGYLPMIKREYRNSDPPPAD